MSGSADALTLDLIIPLYNEAEVLDLLFETLDKTFSRETLAPRNIVDVRYIFIDDGSSDSSARIVSERIRDGVSHSLSALRAPGMRTPCPGLDHATADFVVSGRRPAGPSGGSARDD
jgi:cellulose synthase/poly-beta-1,6-N-acetylglucosamine synthase-like glycosyltransferase